MGSKNTYEALKIIKICQKLEIRSKIKFWLLNFRFLTKIHYFHKNMISWSNLMIFITPKSIFLALYMIFWAKNCTFSPKNRHFDLKNRSPNEKITFLPYFDLGDEIFSFLKPFSNFITNKKLCKWSEPACTAKIFVTH